MIFGLAINRLNDWRLTDRSPLIQGDGVKPVISIRVTPLQVTPEALHTLGRLHAVMCVVHRRIAEVPLWFLIVSPEHAVCCARFVEDVGRASNCMLALLRARFHLLHAPYLKRCDTPEARCIGGTVLWLSSRSTVL